MNYRERFEATLHHRAVDRVPYDIAGTVLTSFSDAQCLKALTDLLHLPAKDEESAKELMLKRFDIDFRSVGDVLPVENSLCKSGSDWFTDGWGIKRKHIGRYYDLVDSPLKGADYQTLKEYPFPDASQISKKLVAELTAKAKRLYEDSDTVVVAGHPVFGVLEIGCWLFGYDDFLLNCALEPDMIQYFFEKIYRFQQDVIELYYGALGRYIHVTTSGDDFGMQNSCMVSPAYFKEGIAPWYKKRIAYTKQFTDAYYFHHTCGSVYNLLDSIVEMGVEILNPIQPGAKDMEPERLKRDYGNQLTFWGGIDEQAILTDGNAEQVKSHVGQVLSVMGRQGGYVLAPSHNIQHDVPPSNIIAMFDAANEFFGIT